MSLGLMPASKALAQVNVTMEQNDIGRTGQNLNETTLTTSNVNPARFGLVFSRPVAGPIHGQPLFVSGLTINGASHDVVFATTQNGVVYAFDAYSNAGTNANALWWISMLDGAHGAAPGASANGSLGTLGTPVIDLTNNTFYVISGTYENSTPVYRLHALDLTSGAEKFGGPVLIAPSVAGTAADAVGGVLTLLPREHQSRTGMLLLNGIVYISFGSRGEGYISTWHGWIVGYDAATLAQTGAFCVTPNGRGGGIWMGGGGMAADQLDPVNYPFGRLFLGTGNGDFTATVPYSAGMDFGDSVLDLDLTNGDPVVTDSFTPTNQLFLNSSDGDQGSGGVLVLPTQTSGAYPHLIVQAGKSGILYLLNRDDLGGYNTTIQLAQVAPNAVGNTGAVSGPAYWNGSVYYWGEYDYLKSFPLSGGQLSTSPTESTEMSSYFGATPTVSANGNTQGIIWTIDIDAATTGGPAILEAHDASNVAKTLYSSAINSARDGAGPAILFSVPTVANGMVYVGTSNQLDVYGLLNGGQTSVPSFSPASEAFATSVKVTLADATPGASIYYTTDGAPATSDSTLYTGPITISSTKTVNAIAVASGFASSNQAWAVYTQQQSPTPTFSPAAVAYPAAQLVTISDTNAKAIIYYTTDGSTPSTTSAVYTGPLSVAATETIKAVALAPGRLLSSPASATYEIDSASTLLLNDSGGFASGAGLNLLGGATVVDNALRLTLATGTSGASAVWNSTPLDIRAFTTDFYFTIAETSTHASGFTFTIQNAASGTTSLGAVSGGLGYQGIGSSVAVKFDIFDNAGEGYDSVGFYLNGVAPTVPAVDMSGRVNLLGNHVLHANIAYDGTTLTLSLFDTVTGVSVTTSSLIDIPTVVGANVAYVGFTAGGGATQIINNWTYVASPISVSQTGAPTFAPGAGVYPSGQSITLSDATPGATIYYTTNGTTPNASSIVYSTPITVVANETLKAVAIARGYVISAVSAAPYQIRVASPTFTPVAGAYTSGQSVTLADATSGAVMYYTTDGTVPTTSSTVYSGPLVVSGDETLRAIAVASGYANSTTATSIYQIKVATPIFAPAAGVYASAQSVTISDAANGAVIYYTTNGAVPTTSSSVYSGPIIVSSDETLKAIAVAAGYANSATVASAYQIKVASPTFSPAAGVYASAQSVTISGTTSDSVIYYTTDGTVPTTLSIAYSGPITVSSNETLKAMAVASGYSNSPTASAVYQIRASVPTFIPVAGTYSGAQSVTIEDATEGTTIYYTIDGTQPTTSSPAYSGTVIVDTTQTLKAIASGGAYAKSLIGSSAYEIK